MLGGFTKALGEEHPFTVSSAENLAGVLRSLKKDDESDMILNKFGLKRQAGPVIEEEGGDEEVVPEVD